MTAKVVFFLPHLGGGGAEMNAVRVATALSRLAYEVSFVVIRGGGSYTSQLPKNVDVHVLDSGLFGSSTLGLIRSIRPLKKYLLQKQPDILCPVMYRPSAAALFAFKGLDAPPKLVLNIQNSYKAKYLDRRGVLAQLEHKLIKSRFPDACHVIALSKGVSEELASNIPQLEGNISIVHNAGFTRDLIGVAPQVAIQKPEGEKLVVACGRLVEQKGYRYLLRALAQLDKSINAHLWILGEGPLKAELVQLAQSLGISDRVSFLGFRNNPRDYMAVADVFVLSSLWEGFGNVIIEAMSVGAPIVSTDCNHGPGEIINDGVDGLLVKCADQNDLARALSKVLCDSDLRKELSEGALDRAFAFTPERIADQYALVFDRVLGR